MKLPRACPGGDAGLPRPRAGRSFGPINLPHFRTYCTDDVAGAEVGGAVKNVLAIACGVAEGRGLDMPAPPIAAGSPK